MRPQPKTHHRLTLSAGLERWPLKRPFRITGYTFKVVDLACVRLECNGHFGHGEAAGVYYREETAASILAQIEAVRNLVEGGATRQELQTLLPPGGARNALDCAMWDLESQLFGRPAWKAAGILAVQPLVTTFTCGAGSPARMAQWAKGYSDARAIKIKLTGEPSDADRVRAVRDARPDVWLGVDVNQGWGLKKLNDAMPALLDARVAVIEQPLPVGQEGLLDGFRSPIPIAADESVQSGADIPSLVGRFDMVNIKLDKCGGLTEALDMVKVCRDLGLQTMVGNMVGTSLAIAPASIVGQLCEVVDLDGPIFLKHDRSNPVQYSAGLAICPQELWGYPRAEDD